MPLFVYRGTDGSRGAELRKTARPRHIAHLEALAKAGRIHFAGPLYDEQGNPCGSLVIFEDEDLASATATAESDPYLAEGVFETIEVKATKAVLP